jgi:hypothetical protein
MLRQLILRRSLSQVMLLLNELSFMWTKLQISAPTRRLVRFRLIERVKVPCIRGCPIRFQYIVSHCLNARQVLYGNLVFLLPHSYGFGHRVNFTFFVDFLDHRLGDHLVPSLLVWVQFFVDDLLWYIILTRNQHFGCITNVGVVDFVIRLV